MAFEPSIAIVEDHPDGLVHVRSDTGEEATVLADSINEAGNRLITFDTRYYRGIHAEMMTHRVFSRNSASSRAIPVMKMVKQVLEDPYVPSYWGAYQAGMQAHQEILFPEEAEMHWRYGALSAVDSAMTLLFGTEWTQYAGKMDVREAFELFRDVKPNTTVAPHKQIVNRVLEPYLWHRVVISSTSWENFYDLRVDGDADPAIHQIAYLMEVASKLSTPEPVDYDDWHTPLITWDERDQLSLEDALKVSAARCARTSYLTHDGKRDFEKDLELFDRLVTGKPHLSPLEHVARPLASSDEQIGNFTGWTQLRGQLFGRSDG